MNRKSTEELEHALGSTHVEQFEKFQKENAESFAGNKDSFQVYIKDILSQKNITQQDAFLRADIPERYGYKLLSGEKYTRQRDVILRICYASELTLAQTQQALKKYGMPQLYAKMERDALLMIIFNERPGSIIDVNDLLKKNGMEPLRTSGIQN